MTVEHAVATDPPPDRRGEGHEEKAPLTVRLVNRFGNALAGGGLSRRRFLGRTAIVASALTVNPLQYVLRPTTAYAQVCGEGASCSGGWSAFCCTINDGANTCPSGSYATGWWKIDASPFCRDGPRYIVDCNRSPSASCSCRCADGQCDRRRTCCNNFRYGQCNTHIGGVTEVVCRVVTCAPPWEWDPACSRTVRTDNRTRSHNASCLPGRNPSPIEVHHQDMGLAGSPLGRATSAERSTSDGGRYRRYQHGSMYWSSATGAHAVLDPLDQAYRNLGGTAGAWRYPRTDTRDAPGGGRYVRFQRGSIYHHDGTGAHGVLGAADTRYRQLDGPAGVLGAITGSSQRTERGWRVTRFQQGEIHASRGGAAELHGAVLTRYRRLGGIDGSGLGHAIAPPRTSSGVLSQRFEHGLLVGPSDSGRVRAVRGPIAERYRELGLADGPWGVPLTDQVGVSGANGVMVEFAEATVYHSDATGTQALSGPVLERFLEEGGPSGWLGFPTSDSFTDRAGQRRASFEHGAILTDPDGDTTRAVEGRATRSRAEAPTPDGGASRRATRSPAELPDP